MDDDGWTKVGNPRRQKQRAKGKEKTKERQKWEKLKEEIPHLVMPARATRLRRKLNIVMLDECLLSDELIEYQRNGWRYLRIIKPDDSSEVIPSDMDNSYSMMDVGNKWGDKILFIKSDVMEEEDNSQIDED